MGDTVCEHGRLARVCESCELHEALDDIAALGQEQDRAEKIRMAANAVANAWEDVGIRPDVHRAAQARLLREWPALRHAVVRLTALLDRETTR